MLKLDSTDDWNDKGSERASPAEIRRFGIWLGVLIAALFVIPILLKAAGLLPTRS